MVRIHPEAEAEITNAAAWYERRQSGKGAEFERAITAAKARIVDAPAAGAPRGRFRGCIVHGFPYTLIYSHNGNVTIFAIAHMSRRPGYWRARLK